MIKMTKMIIMMRIVAMGCMVALLAVGTARGQTGVGTMPKIVEKDDRSLIDTLLKQGQENKVHLVLLWFGTWKNGSNHYMPEWMKRDAVKYPNITGRSGRPVDSPSPQTQAAMEADAKAFSAGGI